LQAFIAEHNGKSDVYFGVMPNPKPTEAKTVWCDIDFKDIPEEVARGNVKEMQPAPHIIVRSGGGLHLYWFVQPIPTNRLRAVNLSIARLIGGDVKSTDTSRILRVPETLNLKYTPPRLCQIEYVAEDLTPYDIGDVSALEEDTPQEAGPTTHDA